MMHLPSCSTTLSERQIGKQDSRLNSQSEMRRRELAFSAHGSVVTAQLGLGWGEVLHSGPAAML
jgi:hypothetical protein